MLMLHMKILCSCCTPHATCTGNLKSVGGLLDVSENLNLRTLNGLDSLTDSLTQVGRNDLSLACC